MVKLVERSVVSVVARRFRSRAVVELENLALRHQLHVLRRQRPGRLRLFTFDRLLWVLLYRLWPRCLEVMVLVKPATVAKRRGPGRRRPPTPRTSRPPHRGSFAAARGEPSALRFGQRPI